MLTSCTVNIFYTGQEDYFFFFVENNEMLGIYRAREDKCVRNFILNPTTNKERSLGWKSVQNYF